MKEYPHDITFVGRGQYIQTIIEYLVDNCKHSWTTEQPEFYNNTTGIQAVCVLPASDTRWRNCRNTGKLKFVGSYIRTMKVCFQDKQDAFMCRLKFNRTE